MMAYSAVQLVAKGEQLTVTGSDGELTVSAFATASVSEAGNSLVQPRPLVAWLGTLGNETLDIVDDGTGDLVISSSGGTPYRFRTVATSFPQAPRLSGAPVKVDLGSMSDAIAAVRSAVDRDNRVVQLVSSSDKLCVNATDTYRLSQAVIPGAGFGEFSGLVPLSLLEQLGNDTEFVVVDASGRVIELRGPSATYTARLVAKPFPAIESVLANMPGSRVRIPVGPAKRALGRLRTIIDQEPLRCVLTQSKMTFSVVDSPLGSGSEEIAVEGGSSAPFEFGVNLEYLDDAFAGRGGDFVSMAYSEPTGALFFIANGVIDVTSVVMPVRL